MISQDEKSIENIKQILRSYSRGQFWLISTGVGLAGILFLLPIDYSPDQVASVLTTLAIVQASILGIVFSVSILGVQLIANRYSPRMMTVITSDPLFRGTLLLFGVSAVFDLLWVLGLPVFSPRLSVGGVAVAGGLAGAFGIGLYRSFGRILEHSTPEGLLEAYIDNITAEDFRTSVRESKNSPKQHPLHDLHELSMAALSRHEWSTAKNGIIYTEIISIRIIETEIKRENLHIGRDELARDYFQVPLKEYLPRTAYRAIEIQEEELATEAISAIEAIGTAGIKNSRPYIAIDSASGLSTFLREIPNSPDEQPLRVNCLDSYRTLLDELFRKPAPNQVRRTFSLYNTQIRIWLSRDHERWEYEDHLAAFYRRCIAPGLGSYLGYYGAYLNTLDMEWHSQFAPDGQTRVVRVLHYLLNHTFKINIYIFQYVDRNEEWPVLITTLRSGLLEMCENSTEGPSELTEVLIRCYIDSAYIASQLDSRNITSSWANSLVHRANRFGGQAVVDEALKTCVSEGVIPQYQSYISRLERQQQSQSGVKQFYHEIAGGKKSYSEWLTEFEEAVADIRKETAED